MKLYILIAGIFVCSSFFIKPQLFQLSPKNIIDFKARRLSNARVFISWHTENEKGTVHFEVVRNFGKATPYLSLGTVQPSLQSSNAIIDYSFIDVNEYPDSSFYRIKKTDSQGVIFYSIASGVEGFKNH